VASIFFWGDSIAAAQGYGSVYDSTYKKRFNAPDGEFPFDDGIALLSAVGRYKPNPWGLYDMAGNVAEWVQDSHQKYPIDVLTSPRWRRWVAHHA
jgi:formylglycine-generating enzyme required for sulfatase activity